MSDEQNSTIMPNLDAPAFKGESQTDRAARAALINPQYVQHANGGRQLCMARMINSNKEEYCALTIHHTGACSTDDVPF
jgi:hypothetical protein